MRWSILLLALAGCDLVFTVPDRGPAPNPQACRTLFGATFPAAATCMPGTQFDSGGGQVVQANGNLVIRASPNNECGCRYQFDSVVQQVAFEIDRPADGKDALSGLQVDGTIDAAIVIMNANVLFATADLETTFGSVPYGEQRWGRIIFGDKETVAELSVDGVSWVPLGSTDTTAKKPDFTFDLIVDLGDTVTGDNAVFSHFIVCAP